ncbi:MAG TPA: BMP family ABC transporter substrate-binding protein [Gaiellaceae bacterium]|nr:BMP family ABC transporter substrate-binding protein [Gaiellaceae bacterium]
MRKRWLSLAALAVATVLLASLVAVIRGGSASAAHKTAFSACLVTDIGGLNDHGFNHLAYLGLQDAKKAGIAGQVLQSTSAADYIPNFQTCVRDNAGITIGIGFNMEAAMDQIATAFPKDKFAIVDYDVTTLTHRPKNVEGLLFREQQAGYLVGYAAGMWTKMQGGTTIGSVGGQKIPPVDRYIAGFQFGAKKADPGIKTLNSYSNDFVKQNLCKEDALNEIAQKADVVFQVAGGCGLGALDAAHEKGIFGIGVDADQGYLGSWVMTSALKRVDVAVEGAIKAAKSGTLKGGTNVEFGANNNGVGYGKWSSKVPASIRTAVAAQLKLLKAGKIKGIPTTVKK